MTVVPLRVVDAVHDRARPLLLGGIGTVAVLLALQELPQVRLPISSDYGLSECCRPASGSA